MRANSSVEVAMDDENSFLSEWQNFSGKLGFNSQSVTDTSDDVKLIGNNDFFNQSDGMGSILSPSQREDCHL